ncbi:hypothetical protein WJX74_007784 [Apatococcus lobatus]|uniref:Uncharacterized protein n=1 Tax=Apatococcus lobatus TaxID=904363 RepID=A0AAW1Q9A2_9CHLO
MLCQPQSAFHTTGHSYRAPKVTWSSAEGEMEEFLPMVANPSMWQSLEQLPESQASGLTTAYTDFGL